MRDILFYVWWKHDVQVCFDVLCVSTVVVPSGETSNEAAFWVPSVVHPSNVGIGLTAIPIPLNDHEDMVYDVQVSSDVRFYKCRILKLAIWWHWT